MILNGEYQILKLKKETYEPNKIYELFFVYINFYQTDFQ